MSHHTYLDAVAAYFRAHPHEDVSNWTLMEIGGSQAWRTRVSECRTKLGMNIRSPRLQRSKTGAVTSWYRYQPAVVPVQAGLFQSEGAA